MLRWQLSLQQADVSVACSVLRLQDSSDGVKLVVTGQWDLCCVLSHDGFDKALCVNCMLTAFQCRKQ